VSAALLAATQVLAGCRVGYEDLALQMEGTSSGGSSVGSSGSASGGGDTTAGGDDNEAAASSGGTNSSGGGSNAGSSAGGTEADSGGAPSAGAASGGTTATSGTGGGGTGTTGGTSTGGSGPTGPCRSGSYGGHDYEHCDAPAAYASARADCESRGLRLARVDDAAEDAWIHSTIPAADQANNNTSLWRWLGGDDLAVASTWAWNDGTAFWSGGNKGMPVGGAYANWTKNQPLNPHCLAMEARDGFWYAMDCAAARPYVCELY
jgi:hypothetical protein